MRRKEGKEAHYINYMSATLKDSVTQLRQKNKYIQSSHTRFSFGLL